MLKEPQEKEKPTVGSIVAGILLTLLAVPLLIVATCVPALWTAHIGHSDIAVVIWVLAILGIGVWRAIVTDNPGTRWTIIVVTALAGAAAAQWALSEVVGIRLY